MYRIGKSVITGVLVLLLAVDPASASRWRWFGGSGCRPAPVYCSPMPVYCPPAPSYCYEGDVEMAPLPDSAIESQLPTPPAPPMEDTGRPELPTEVERPETVTPSPSDAVPTPPIRPIPQQPTPDDAVPTPDAPAVPDLFDESPAPADPPVIPEDMPPADATPADTLPDLLDETPAAPEVTPDETPMPDTPMPDAVPPADGTDIDQLFNDSSAVEPAIQDSAVSPASAETPVIDESSAPVLEEPKTTTDDIDSLFETPTASPQEPATDAAEPMTSSEPATETLDLFPEPAATTPATSDVSESEPAESTKIPRTWTDNTGKYQVRASLLVILNGKVRLLKETGRTTTVPFERLSKTDRAFVEQQVQLLAVTQADSEL